MHRNLNKHAVLTACCLVTVLPNDTATVKGMVPSGAAPEDFYGTMQKTVKKGSQG